MDCVLACSPLVEISTKQGEKVTGLMAHLQMRSQQLYDSAAEI